MSQDDMPTMKTFRLHWRGSKPQFVIGYDIADACQRAGVGAGALPALDYWERVTGEEAEQPSAGE